MEIDANAVELKDSDAVVTEYQKTLDNMQKYPENLQVQKDSIEKLENLDNLESMKLIPLLLKAMTNYPDHFVIQQKCCQILYGVLKKYPSLKYWIGYSGSIQSVIKALPILGLHCEDALDFLDQLAHIQENQVRMTYLGAHAAIADIMIAYPDHEKIQINGCKVINNLVQFSPLESLKAAISGKCLQAVISFMKSESGIRNAEVILNALRSFVYDRIDDYEDSKEIGEWKDYIFRVMDIILSFSVIEGLVNTMKYSDSDSIREKSCSLLSVLACDHHNTFCRDIYIFPMYTGHDDIQDKVWNAGGFEVIVKYLKEPSPSTSTNLIFQRTLIMSMIDLSWDFSVLLQEFIKLGAIPLVMNKIIENGYSPEISSEALQFLNWVAMSTKFQKGLKDHKDFKELKKSIIEMSLKCINHHYDTVNYHALQTIMIFAEDYPECCQEFGALNGVSILLKLLSKFCYTSKVTLRCLQVIKVLADDGVLLNDLVECGAIKSIFKIIEVCTAHPVLYLNALKAIYALDCKQPVQKKNLHEHGSVYVILRMMCNFRDHKEIQDQGYYILADLAKNSVLDQDNIVSLGGIEYIISSLKNHYSEICYVHHKIWENIPVFVALDALLVDNPRNQLTFIKAKGVEEVVFQPYVARLLEISPTVFGPAFVNIGMHYTVLNWMRQYKYDEFEDVYTQKYSCQIFWYLMDYMPKSVFPEVLTEVQKAVEKYPKCAEIQNFGQMIFNDQMSLTKPYQDPPIVPESSFDFLKRYIERERIKQMRFCK